MTLQQLNREDLLRVLKTMEYNLCWLNWNMGTQRTFENKIKIRSDAVGFAKIILILYIASAVISIPQISFVIAFFISVLIAEESKEAVVAIPIALAIAVILIVLAVAILKKIWPKINKFFDKEKTDKNLEAKLAKASEDVDEFQAICDKIATDYNFPKELCYPEGVEYVVKILENNQNCSLDKAIAAYNDMCMRRERERESAARDAYERYQAEQQRKREAEFLDAVDSQKRLLAQQNEMLANIEWRLNHKI